MNTELFLCLRAINTVYADGKRCGMQCIDCTKLESKKSKPCYSFAGTPHIEVENMNQKGNIIRLLKHKQMNWKERVEAAAEMASPNKKTIQFHWKRGAEWARNELQAELKQLKKIQAVSDAGYRRLMEDAKKLQAEIEQLKEANYQRAKIANNVFQKEIEQLQADNENMKAALEEIMEVVGTSSLQHKIAREALK